MFLNKRKNHQILVVIVLYKIKLKDSLAYRSLSKNEMLSFYIYDNSPDEFKYAENNPNIVSYHYDDTNSGLSIAYNCAARFAQQNGYLWLLLSDQDTYYPDSYIKKMHNAMIAHHNIMLFAPKIEIGDSMYMSPTPMKHYISTITHCVPNGIINPLNFTIINSGLIIKIEAFFKVGGYNEAVKVDFSDLQFIERFSQYYDKAYIVDVSCRQLFSDKDQTIDQKLERFNIFCQSVKNYEPIRKMNKFWLLLVVAKRAISLILQGGGLSPVKSFFKYYL